MEQARDQWVYSDGHERIEMDGSLYVVHDAVLQGNNRINFTLSPPPSVLGDDEPSSDGEENGPSTPHRDKFRRVLRKIRNKITRLVTRERHHTRSN